jgi:phenylpyruvate tautomerase PptA (4-oxalocrotonate tautomerase family)
MLGRRDQAAARRRAVDDRARARGGALCPIRQCRAHAATASCFVNEQDVFVGGQPHANPIYRVTVTVPESSPGLIGPLAERGREKLVERVTAAVLAAEGSESTMVEAHRVWVHLRQITNGHWAGFGEVFTVADAAAYGLTTDEPDSSTARMRRAALDSVGATAAG